jgi:hypothetical protein
MKIFFTKTLLYFLLLGVLLSLYVALIFFKPDLVDAFYYRFTTPKATSLILGASRAGQGIHPEIINRMLLSPANKIVNHAFAIGASSYGPNYLNELKKLDTTSNKGLFIFSVTPGNLSVELENTYDDSSKFFEVERKLFVGNIKSSSINPNLDYLINHWVNRFEPFARMFKYAINYKGISVLHEDGWLEVTTSMDSASNNERIRRSTEENRNYKWKLSKTRINYLEKMIRYADKYGDVFLIRMPVTPQMAEIEKGFYPEFDSIMIDLANRNQLCYINFIDLSGKFLTIDTHHLYKKEGARFTGILCDSIISCYKNKPEYYNLAVGSDKWEK